MNIRKRILEGDELDQIMRITQSDVSSAEKKEQIRTQFISLIMRHASIAKEILEFEPETEQGKEYVERLLSITGQVLSADLNMFKFYGADIGALVSILDADLAIIDRIKHNGDEGLQFDEIVINYHLGNTNYPEIVAALKAFKEKGV